LLEITCQSDFASLVSGRKLPIVILSPSTGSGQAPRRISADLLTMRFFVDSLDEAVMQVYRGLIINEIK
jgi:hypothetical protein